MDSKMTVCLETTKVDGDTKRHYQFIFPYAAPLGETYDFCYSVLQEVTKMAQKSAEAAQPPKVEDKPAA